MTGKKVRVLVVDDTVLYRKVISDVLAMIPEVEVVGTANNGKIALAKVEQLTPDLMTLDFEMPVMDGLATLLELKRMKSDVAVIMVSAHTSEGAAVTMKALEHGAFDFIAKPDGASLEKNRQSLLSQLRPVVQTVATRRILRPALTGIPRSVPPVQPVSAASRPATAPVRRQEMPPATSPAASAIRPVLPSGRIAVVAIGISTGGPNALAEVIPRLPKNLRVPVVIVQHMPPVFTKALADSLNQKSAVNVIEAQGEERLEAGNVYIAPGGKQMKVVKKATGEFLQLTDDPPENHCKPAVDYLFRSVSSIYGNRALGVIMTGMGSDGVKGLRLMKQQGSQVIAQDETSCVVFGMPMEAIKAGVADVVVPLHQISAEIVNRVK
ncbi:MAG: chemotaxis response regulator protein-glutamate methylesterase [Desulfobulbaceae bacterium DB1]|nr:MAG: chemotaxis response regulator protein-glutamate methylesterase [Desulfobulbaceae bacterium DB1]